MKEEKQTVTAKQPVVEPKFTKAQLLSSKRFLDRKDAFEAVLKDGESYTVKEAEALFDNYMKGQVK